MFEAPDDAHILRICCLNDDSKVSPNDLIEYIHDLLYSGEIQKDLFKFLLPKCLLAWREYLVDNNQSYGGYAEYLLSFLAKKELYSVILSDTEYTAIATFYAKSLLDRMSSESKLSHQGMDGTPYRWFYALSSYCVIFSDLESFWNEWWVMKKSGHAVCVLQYISCIMYAEEANPIFKPWTKEYGGGAPTLWEWEGHIYGAKWEPRNIEFLKSTLTKEYIYNHLKEANQFLDDEQNKRVGQKMLDDFNLQEKFLLHRINRLLEIVSKSVDAITWDENK